MSTSSSAKRRQFWRYDWFVGACIVVAVFVLWKSTDLFEAMERRFYDVASVQGSRQPSERIAIIAIDGHSIANIGRWPYAHRQNVVHRDIKPANIMYELGSDTVKVTDFGIARITDFSKTKTGMVLGTPSFMSPEQIAGKKVDGRSDLYSLGVMLYQMLTGVLPFRGDSMAEVMYEIANAEAPDLRTVRSDLPEQLAQVVARALAKKPELRYQDGDEFAGDLRTVIAQLGGAAVRSGPAKPTDSLSLAAAAKAHAVAEKTLVMAAGHLTRAGAGSDSSSGYDPAAKEAAADDPFAKTAVFARPDGPGYPPGGGGQSVPQA